jgi:hypothetical protein
MEKKQKQKQEQIGTGFGSVAPVLAVAPVFAVSLRVCGIRSRYFCSHWLGVRAVFARFALRCR